jgi:hypothetical protein
MKNELTFKNIQGVVVPHFRASIKSSTPMKDKTKYTRKQKHKKPADKS